MHRRSIQSIVNLCLCLLFCVLFLGADAQLVAAESRNIQELGSGLSCSETTIMNKKGRVLPLRKARKKITRKIQNLAGKTGKKVRNKRKSLKATRKLLAACSKGELAAAPVLALQSTLCTSTMYDAGVSLDPAQPGTTLSLQISDDAQATWFELATATAGSSQQTSIKFTTPDTAGVYHIRAVASGTPALASQGLEVQISKCGSSTVDYNLPMVRAGGFHSCVIDTNGETWCWGRNERGEVGDGTTEPRLRPVRVAGNYEFAFIAVGYQHTCALEKDGKAYCWGQNFNFSEGPGALGDGSETDRSSPTPVAGGLRFKMLTAGTGHTCGLTFQDIAYCWGANARGQLGDGTGAGGVGATKNALVPTSVSGSSNYIKIAVKSRTSCALTSSGRIDCWGAGLFTPDGKKFYDPNIPVAQFSGYKDVDVGETFRCGLKSNGTAECWGSESNGALGNGGLQDDGSVKTPDEVNTSENFIDFSIGGQGGCGLNAAGKAFCWGYNVHGAVGDGNGGSLSRNRVSPVAVTRDITFDHVDSGYGHVCGVSSSGNVYCWGLNGHGQLGAGVQGLPSSLDEPFLVTATD